MDIDNLSITNVKKALDSKQISAAELTVFTLNKIKNSVNNAYIYVDEKNAIKRATDFDNGKFGGKLGGIPIAIKDNIHVKDMPTTCASKALIGSEKAKNNAIVVQKLLNEGAIILGKTNMDEFAMGSSNTTSAFGTVKNPYDIDRVCGGSSGGSACAVASNQAFMSLGSDTGGSIRQPASYCNVVGLKPSSNMIQKEGIYPLAPSFDEIGPITRTVEDCKLVFNILSNQKEAEFKRKPKVGIIKNLNIRWNDAKFALNQAINHLEAKNIELVEVDISFFKYAYEVYNVIAYSQMYQSISSLNLNQELLGTEVKKRIKAGQYCLDDTETIAQALKTQQRLISQFDAAFKLCDAIITPSAPSTPFKHDELTLDQAINSDFFTQPPSICNLSAISVPFLKINNLPLGIQIISKSQSPLFATANQLS